MTANDCSGCGTRPIAAARAVLNGRIACCPDCDTFTADERNELRAILAEKVHAVYGKPAPALGYDESIGQTYAVAFTPPGDDRSGAPPTLAGLLASLAELEVREDGYSYAAFGPKTRALLAEAATAEGGELFDEWYERLRPRTDLPPLDTLYPSIHRIVLEAYYLTPRRSPATVKDAARYRAFRDALKLFVGEDGQLGVGAFVSEEVDFDDLAAADVPWLTTEELRRLVVDGFPPAPSALAIDRLADFLVYRATTPTPAFDPAAPALPDAEPPRA